MSRRLLAVAAVLVSSLQAGGTVAGQDIEARAANVTVGGRLHTQFMTSSVDDAAPRDFFIRRARVAVDVGVNDRVDGRLITDFALGQVKIQDAYLRYRFTSAFRVSVGQFKRAFDPFELESSTRLPLVERDGRVPGVDNCDGVGGTCSYSRLTQKLKYAERDAGVRIDGALGDRATYQVTVTNGEGINKRDINQNKSFSARVEVAASDNVTVAGNVGLHDYLDPDGAAEYGNAFGADVTVGDHGGGPRLVASVVSGDNWQVLDATGAPVGFTTAQVVGTYYFETSSDLIEGFEPVLRVGTADPNGDVSDDGGTLLTPGFHAYFQGRNRVGVNVDIFNPSTGDADWSLKFMTYLYF